MDRGIVYEDQQLIVVSSEDEELSPLCKADCHAGDGILHRAFSLFLFDREGRLLLQRRSQFKPLWPGFWSNSCCSHPRWGESISDAVKRRTSEELGVTLSEDPSWHFSFTYHARYEDVGSEYELCHVFSAVVDVDRIEVDAKEADAVQWMSISELDMALGERVGNFTPWLLLEWPRLKRMIAPEVGGS